MTTPDIPQTAGWVGIVNSGLLLIRQYADGTLTASTRDDHGWLPEVELTAERIEVAS